uniref:Condensin complex subunit 1 C-terminal domain-containing protein n=1 Tax=Setaria digitata TaxID=48799 RepID=A0A915PJQ2_9BILA
MEEKNKLFEVLEDISIIFSEVSDEWTTVCYEDNFSDFASFVHAVRFSILQAFDYLLRLSELCSRLLFYAVKGNLSTEIWNEMTERNFDARKLCIFAWYLIERGQQPNAALDDRKIGLIGSRIYLSLCCLNGAQAFNIFNDYLFQRALEQLRIIHRLLGNSCFSTANDHIGLSGRTKNKSKKPSDAANSRLEQTGFELLALEDETELRYMLCDVLDSIFIFLSRVTLSSTQQSSISLAVFLQQLMQIDFSDKTSVLESNRLSDFQRLRGFSDRSFALIHRFLERRHSSSCVVYGRIVMPRLLFWTLENTVFPTNAHPPKLISTYKEAMLSFIRIRIEKGSVEEISTILLVLQNMCFRCPDRNDYRAKVASSVVEVLAYLPPTYIKNFAAFLQLTFTNSRISVRGFAVEIAVSFMKQYSHILEVSFQRENLAPAIMREACDSKKMNENDISDAKKNSIENNEADEDGAGNKQQIQKKTRRNKVISDSLMKKIDYLHSILVLLLQCCNDKSPMVRARALMQVAILLNDENIRCKFLSIPGTSVHICDNRDEDTAEKHQNRLPHLSIIIKRCLDARQRCRDPSLLVRKQAAESLTRLLSSLGASSNIVDKAWLTSVLPMINDREQSVVQQVSKLIMETLILPVLKDTTPMVWRVLEAVEQEVNYRRLLLRSLLHQAREGELTEHVIENLAGKYDDLKNANIIWMLLSFLSSIFKIDASPVIRFWYKLNESDESNLISYVAEVIGRCADHISEADRNQLIENIGIKLTRFSVNEGHIGHVYYAFARLYRGIGDDATGAKSLLEFNRILMDKSLKVLHSIIFCPIDTTGEVRLSQEKAVQLLIRIISSLGEAIQYSPILLRINPKSFDIMQLIIASDVLQQHLTQTGTLCSTAPAVPSVPSIAIHCTDREGFANSEPQQDGVQQGVDADIPEHSSIGILQRSKFFSNSNNNMQGSVKVPVSTNQKYRASQPISQGLGPTFLGQHAVNMEVLTPAVRAQAVLAIGKMCLQDEKLAKKCVPVFSRQLLVNSNHVVRSNIVGVICDLCKRYTLLVDRHSAIVASCLKDSSTLVRKQTLMLLTHLIKEQFVRWEGQIMYRFVSAILDENMEVREYAEMCLVDVLLVQFPNMFVNHFLECVFYFNSVTHCLWLAANNGKVFHNITAAFEYLLADLSAFIFFYLSLAMEENATERQELKCSLSGFRLKNARMSLYRFMFPIDVPFPIKTFNDENKFTIGMRIGQEVYSAVVDGVLDIHNRCVRALLEDCYEIMCCSEIKLSMALGKKSPNDTDDDDEPPSNVQEAARNVVTQAFRKGIIDAILPHVIRLKYYLQEKRLPELEFGIIRVLRELCKDHREQLDEFLASDKQLKAEIKFDLEKLEEKEKRMNSVNNNEAIMKTPCVKSKRVSFAADNVACSTEHSTTKQRREIETASDQVERNEGKNRSILRANMSLVSSMPQLIVPRDHFADRNNQKPTEIIGEMEMNNDRGENIDNLQPSTSVKEEVDITTAVMMVKKSSQRTRFEQLNEEREVPARAVSTPEHNIGELTFGLGDEMSAIESTPSRKRSRRQARQPYVAPIKEVDNENE